MGKIYIEILFLDKCLHSPFNRIRYLVYWGSATVLMNDELNPNFLIFLKISFNGSSGFIEQLSGINDRDFAFSNLGNNIDGELGFGIHNNHPLRSPNIQCGILRESLIK